MGDMYPNRGLLYFPIMFYMILFYPIFVPPYVFTLLLSVRLIF